MGLKDTDLGREMTLPLAAVCFYSSLAGAGFGYDNLLVGLSQSESFGGVSDIRTDIGVVS